MKTRPPLTNKRRTWAEQRGGHTFEGLPLNYPAPVMLRYESSLKRMIDDMTKSYRKELTGVFNQLGYQLPGTAMDASIASQATITLNKLRKRFESLFNKRSKVIADNVINQLEKYTTSSLNQSLKQLSGGLTLKTSVMPRALREAMKASIAENVSLIRSIPQQFHTQIEGDVMRSMQPGGNGLQDVYESLQKQEGITDRRARTIARDQVRKATSSLNTEKNKALGIRKFKWNHSGGGAEPRELHLELDGQIFSYDDPPIIDQRTGERGFPGQLINCKCTATPVLDFGEEDEAA